MKIKSIKVLDDGMRKETAQALWNDILAFGSYSFNLSHSVEYAIVSFWTAYLRAHYAAEYFAACMSIVKEEKLPGLVSDAREAGIEVLPPDINLSGTEFSIPDSKHIVAPFSAMKGCSAATAARIVELRERNRTWKVLRVKKKRDGTTEDVWGMDLESPVRGRFDSANEFVLAAEQPGSKVNSKVVDALRRVGALASVEPGELPARHMDRRKDQMELLPGLIIDTLKAERTTDAGEPFLRKQIVQIIKDYRECEGCSLAGQPHPTIRVKSNVKFMVISDCPSWPEEKAEKLLEGDAAAFVKSAITSAGLSVAEGYYTTLVKAKKQDKFLTNEQLNGCRKFLDRELELIKPAAIVALGSATIKRLLPDVKGSTEELAGKAVYVPALDATVICGINPMQIIFNESKRAVLEAVFERLAEVVL